MKQFYATISGSAKVLKKTILVGMTGVLVLGLAATIGVQPASASDCERFAPTVEPQGPDVQEGSPGQNLTFTLALTNNDNQFCPRSAFTFTNRSLPAGWSVSPATGTEWVDPTEIIGYSISYTSPTTAFNGDYDFTLDLTRAEQPDVTSSIVFRYTVVNGQEPDTTAPSLLILSPLNNSTVRKNSNVTILALAQDQNGVVRIDYLVDDVLVCTGNSSSCVWHVPNRRGTFQIKVQAYDAADNVATRTIQVRSR